VQPAQRVAIHLPSATAVAADLHLGYGQARRRGGDAVPEPDLAEQLAPLRAALERHDARRLVLAGDVLEDGKREKGVLKYLIDWLAEASVELVGLVPGNHDLGLCAEGVPVCRGGVTLGQWRVVHGDGELPAGPVVHGHEHPCLRWDGRRAVPCYLFAEGRLVLPAYSADAAGGNVLGVALWSNYRCAAIAGEQVLDLGPVGALRAHLRP
jgi:metallophosphoesterase superfamily enzyme